MARRYAATPTLAVIQATRGSSGWAVAGPMTRGRTAKSLISVSDLPGSEDGWPHGSRRSSHPPILRPCVWSTYMRSRATPEQIRAVTDWLVGGFPGCTVDSQDNFVRGSRLFRVDGPDDRPVAVLEIVMETFQDEATPAEIVGRLDDAGYHGKLVKARHRPVVVFHPSFGSSLA